MAEPCHGVSGGHVRVHGPARPARSPTRRVASRPRRMRASGLDRHGQGLSVSLLRAPMVTRVHGMDPRNGSTEWIHRMVECGRAQRLRMALHCCYRSDAACSPLQPRGFLDKRVLHAERQPHGTSSGRIRPLPKALSSSGDAADESVSLIAAASARNGSESFFSASAPHRSAGPRWCQQALV